MNRANYIGRLMKVHSTREEWLAERGNYIGASELPALLCDCHPYLTPFKLSAKKLRLVPDESESKEAHRGRRLEPVAIECIREDNPTWDVRYNTFPRQKYFIDDNHKIGATPDAFITLPDRSGDGILQIKSVHPYVFKRGWLDDGGLIEPPLWVAIQASIEAALAGADYAFIAPLRVNWGMEVDAIEIPLIEGLYDRACEAADAFWAKVGNGEMYEPDFSKDSRLITTLYGPAAEPNPVPPIDLSDDNEVHVLRANYAAAAGWMRRGKEDREAIKAKMLLKMSGSPTAIVNGEVFATVKRVDKAAYTAKAYSYPQLQFKDADNGR